MLATLSTDGALFLVTCLVIASWCLMRVARSLHLARQSPVLLPVGIERPSLWASASRLGRLALWVTAPVAVLSLALNLIRFARGA